MPFLTDIGLAILKPVLQILFWILIVAVLIFAAKYYMKVKAAADAAINTVEVIRVRREIERAARSKSDDAIDDGLRNPSRRSKH